MKAIRVDAEIEFSDALKHISRQIGELTSMLYRIEDRMCWHKIEYGIDAEPFDPEDPWKGAYA